MNKTYNGRFDSPEEPKSGMKQILIGLALIPTWPTMFTIAVSIGCFIKGGSMAAERRMYRRFHEFCAVIGMRDHISVRELAKVSHMGKDETRRYLQRMIAAGYFGSGAYLDVNRDELILSAASGGDARQTASGGFGWRDVVMDILQALRGEKLHAEKKAKRRAEYGERTAFVETDFAPDAPKAKHAPEQLTVGKETQKRTAETNTDEKSAEQKKGNAGETGRKRAPDGKKVYLDELERTLNELYELNERIADEAVSRRIDRIGTLVAGIFGAVIDDPSREQDVRRFMNYYLPQTLKLIKSYDMLEDQHYQSENIVASRQKIENVLDMLIEAYEKQLDRLFKNDALDIATDIDVLETMMAGDGLSDKGKLRMKL